MPPDVALIISGGDLCYFAFAQAKTSFSGY
jgi:hypothetical protein